EVRRATRPTARDHHEPVRHHHGSVCDGVEPAAQPETGGGRWRSQCRRCLRCVLARCHRQGRTLVEDSAERLCPGRRTAAKSFPRARLRQSRSGECDRTATQDCGAAAGERAVYSLSGGIRKEGGSMALTNHKFLLAARPVGMPKRSDWTYTEEPVR